MKARIEHEQALQAAFAAGLRQRLEDARRYEELVRQVEHTPPTRWEFIQELWQEIERIKNAYHGHPPTSVTL